MEILNESFTIANLNIKIKNETNNMDNLNDQIILCCICKNHGNEITMISMDKACQDYIIVQAIEQMYPQFDFDDSENSAICDYCQLTLSNFTNDAKINLNDNVLEECESDGFQIYLIDPLIVKLTVNKEIDQLCRIFNMELESEGNINEDEICVKERNKELDSRLQQHLQQNHNVKHRGIKHSLIHENERYSAIYKCKHCEFQTKYGRKFDFHSTCHKNEYQTIFYTCLVCSFKSKRKSVLMTHNREAHIVSIHKNKLTPGTDTYSYTNIQNDSSIKTEVINEDNKEIKPHKTENVIQIYKCPQCTFTTKWYTSVKKHLHLHKNDNEVNIYKCNVCIFQTRHKTNLKYHSLLHKNKDELTKYKCDTCPYETIHRTYLKKHGKVHKSENEVEMYNCHMCSFRTKHKNYLKSHALVHTNNDKIMLKCSECTFQTKYKTNLKKHILLHTDNEILFKCSECTFQTKFKKNLKWHLLNHKSENGVKMYKCPHCVYQSKVKHSLSRHLRVHREEL